MARMKELLKIAERIRNAELRKKTISILKNPFLSNRNFSGKHSGFENAPASLNWHHVYEGGLAEHTLSVTKMSVRIAEVLRSVYGIKTDTDVLIAGCLLHDIGKVFEYIKSKDEWDSSEILLDHTMLGTSELYSRGFPPEVIHMVASHFGDKGPTPPMTIEAKILSAIDLFDAGLESESSSEEDETSSLLDLIRDIRSK
ncbi:MAG: HDIG domain-containing protein [Candidatus Aenigmarchaeota archaeon]|nr:HDIG domain-containing protein [Candidatus Aenigmarchaeota archaeon]